MSQHYIRVVMLVDGDEYICLQSMSDDDGLSDSAFMRRLLKLEAQRRAMARVLATSAMDERAEPAQLVRTSGRGSFAA